MTSLKDFDMELLRSDHLETFDPDDPIDVFQLKEHVDHAVAIVKNGETLAVCAASEHGDKIALHLFSEADARRKYKFSLHKLALIFVYSVQETNLHKKITATCKDSKSANWLRSLGFVYNGEEFELWTV